MKILKIFGIVVGIHVFALLLIFANPGCSTTTKPRPAPSDTLSKSDPPPTVTVPNTTASVYTAASEPAPATPAPVAFDPNATATATPGAGAMSVGSAATTVRFTPTRPGTPVASTLVVEKVADVTPATTYVVKAGDSLWSIAKKHRLTVADLTAANGIAANANLQPGKKLLIPAKSLPASAAATAPTASVPAKAVEPSPGVRANGEGVKHTVKSGETLGTIARNYGVRSADIAVANRISDPAKIQAGMELIIPGWQAAKTRSGKGGGKASTAAATKAEPAVEAPAAPAQPVVTPPIVPIIRIDDSPVTPAPKR